MPQAGPAIAAISAAVGTFFTAKAAIYVIARFVVFAAVSYLLAKRAAGFSPGLESRAITSRGTVEPQQRIYGEALVSGPVVFNDVAGVVNRDLYVVIPLAGHEVDSIGDIWLDANVVANASINGGAAGGGLVGSGKFAPVDGYDILRINKHLGTSSQTADSDMVSAFTAWTSAHRLRGIAYIVAKLTLLVRAEELWNGAEPANLRALVRGCKVYDPRLDSTQSGLSPAGSGSHRYATPSTWAWSDNPSLCVADYLMDSRFGMGLDPTRIDWQSVLDSAEACEVTVDIPGPSTEQRYRCNGSLYATATHRDNLRDLLSSMNGELTVSAGQWFIRAGEYTAPSVTFTADNLADALGIKANLERGERFNTIKGVFIDAAGQYKPTESPPVTTATLLARDNGRILETEVDLPFTSGFYMAQRLLWKQLHIADQEMQVSTKLNLKAATAAVGDRITLDIDELSWSPKTFKLGGWKLTETGDEIGVAVELREDAAAAYDDPLIANYTTRNTAGVVTFADPDLGPTRAYDWFTEDDFGHDDAARALAEWSEIVSAGPLTDVVTLVGSVGPFAWEVGDNSGDDMLWRGINRRRARPILAGRIYCLSGWVRRSAGSAPIYLGVNGFSGDVRSGGGVAVNSSGADSLSSQHYVVGTGSGYNPPGTGWAFVEGYFKLGTGSSTVFNAGTINDPHELHQDVEYVAPLVLLNYNGAAGIQYLGYVKLAEMDGRSVGATLGTNLFQSNGTTLVTDNDLIRIVPSSWGVFFSTYEAGGWSESPLDIDFVIYRGATAISWRTLRFTVTTSGANEGDVAVSLVSGSGESNSSTTTLNNQPAGYVELEHTASGVSLIVPFGSDLPGYSGGVLK